MSESKPKWVAEEVAAHETYGGYNLNHIFATNKNLVGSMGKTHDPIQYAFCCQHVGHGNGRLWLTLSTEQPVDILFDDDDEVTRAEMELWNQKLQLEVAGLRRELDAVEEES